MLARIKGELLANSKFDKLSLINALARAQDIERLIEHAKDPQLEPMLRRTAIRKLGTLGDRRALATLTASAEDPDADVRLTAARALGLLGDPRGSAPLLGMLERDASPIARAWAADSLGRLREREAVAALTNALGETHWQPRSAAAAALARIGAPEALPAVKEAVARESRITRKLYLWRMLRRLRLRLRRRQERVP